MALRTPLYSCGKQRDGLKKSFDVYYFSRLRICVLPKLGEIREKPTSKGQEFAECCNNSSRFCTYPSLYFFDWFVILHGLHRARCFGTSFWALSRWLHAYKLAMSFRKQSELSRGSTSFSSSNDPVWTGNCNVRHNVIADSPNKLVQRSEQKQIFVEIGKKYHHK